MRITAKITGVPTSYVNVDEAGRRRPPIPGTFDVELTAWQFEGTRSEAINAYRDGIEYELVPIEKEET